TVQIASSLAAPRLGPHPVKLFFKIGGKFSIVYDDDILVIDFVGVAAEIEGAENNYFAVDNDYFVVHNARVAVLSHLQIGQMGVAHAPKVAEHRLRSNRFEDAAHLHAFQSAVEHGRADLLFS